MSATTASNTASGRFARKMWREATRPLRQFSRRVHGDSHHVAPAVVAAPEAAADKPYLTGTASSFSGFHPQQATVEPEGIPLIQRLVRELRKYPGPIIEVGTLLGITTTNMALAMSPEQKIITVDLYCWNPWGLTPDVHEALCAQVLYYLTQSGHVQRIRADKNDFFKSYNGPAPSMVFLDAMHDYAETKKDIQWARKAGAKIIAGHDYCDAFPGVKKIVDECGGPRELGGSVWVL